MIVGCQKQEFLVDGDLKNQDSVLLCCDELDTLSEIRINDIKLAETDNMHRRYEFDIKDLLQEGINKINITLYSPVKYVQQKHKENLLWGIGDCIQGYPHLRKAHCMFGWDWGSQIPYSGIWRDIYITSYNKARL